MVGFGSGLRMGRRTGWESAYLDYETLKLLLSQIEAVYEERDLGTGMSADGFFMSMPGGLSGGVADSERNVTTSSERNNENSRPKTTNYRDELFLESDSDLAFASEVDVNDNSSESDEYRNRDYDIDRAMMDESFDYSYTGMTVWEQQGLGQHHMHVEPFQAESTTSTGTMTLGHQQRQQMPSAFSVSAYATTKSSSVYSSSSEEDEDYYAINSDYHDKCAPWSAAKTKKKDRHQPSSSKKKKPFINNVISRRKSKKKQHHRESLGNHLQRTNSGGMQDAFIVEKGTSGDDYYDANTNHRGNNGTGTNYYYYKFDRNDDDDADVSEVAARSAVFRSTVDNSESIDNSAKFGREGAPLLGRSPSTPTTKNSSGRFVSFPTPGRVDSIAGRTDGYGSLLNQNTNFMTPAKPLATTMVPSTIKETNTATKYKKTDDSQNRYERERRHARKQRRRRRLIRQRKEREKTVPPHIRIAHEKSRAITERFLGLLRAEVEKVTLFAQARLGELADTAGSLRFLSSDETMGMEATHTGSYDYPLSDGGIHPSASSSSDEGAGGGQYYHKNKGGFPWSDSSSEDEVRSKASGAGRLDIAQTFSSTDGYSAKTDPRGNISERSTFSTYREEIPSMSGERSPQRPAFTETLEKFEATTRKIAHFQEIRRERSIFQRNDYIVGEDLLLMTAVDEADAFSALGVELLHILKYICVNLIAVRKICKKHDRLLMNRMLGGYYHRKRTTRSQEDTTLGGLIAHVAGDIYEAHPDLIGLVNNGKLIGIYDLKIQQLANSRTVKVVSSCLALALSEYEVSRSRAEEYAKLNPGVQKGRKPSSSSQSRGTKTWPFSIGPDTCLRNQHPSQQHDQSNVLLQHHNNYVESDDEHGEGPPSTTSSLSLSRLRYTVLSIAALREASRIKSNPFSSYLSRSTLAFTGHAIIGEGLDGCSRETLDVLLAYNPDAALLLDTSVIYEGLTCGQWRKASIANVMTSSLAVALTLPSSGQTSSPLTMSPRMIREKESVVSSALGILPPKSESLDSTSPLDGPGLPPSIFLRISRFTDIPPSLLRANRLSLFLYNANYFIAYPTSVTLVLDSDENIAYSALVIGAPTLSAILVSMLHCHFLSEYTTRKESNDENVSIFRILLLFSCLSAVVGNIVQAYGIKHTSIQLTILGRFLLGLSAVDIMSRQFVICFLPACLIVAESARLVQFQVTGQIMGLLIGSSAGSFVKTSSEFNMALSSIVVENDAPTTNSSMSAKIFDPLENMMSETRDSQLDALTTANWFMVSLWLIYLVYILFGWRVSSNTRQLEMKKGEYSETDASDHGFDVNENDNSTDSSVSDQETGRAGLLHNTRDMGGDRNYAKEKSPNTTVKETGEKSSGPMRKRRQGIRTFTKRIRKLMMYSIAIPVSLVVIVGTVFVQELLLSSCALITKSYFDWRGSFTGFFLALLSVILLPMDYFCEHLARRYEERFTARQSIYLLSLGLLVMVNWGSLFALIPNMKNLFKQDRSNRHHHYDWMLGVGQYIVGFIIAFAALRALGVGSRSLLSKVSPPNLQSVVINLGTIVTFATLLSQMFADFYISSVVFSHREINIDILNSLLMPSFIATILMYYLVRKHYFFLM